MGLKNQHLLSYKPIAKYRTISYNLSIQQNALSLSYFNDKAFCILPYSNQGTIPHRMGNFTFFFVTCV